MKNLISNIQLLVRDTNTFYNRIILLSLVFITTLLLAWATVCGAGTSRQFAEAGQTEEVGPSSELRISLNSLCLQDSLLTSTNYSWSYSRPPIGEKSEKKNIMDWVRMVEDKRQVVKEERNRAMAALWQSSREEEVRRLGSF